MGDRVSHLLDWLKDGYTHCQHGGKDWCESYLKNARAVIEDQDAHIATLERQVEEMRETNRKLHRRVQMAEKVGQSFVNLIDGWKRYFEGCEPIAASKHDWPSYKAGRLAGARIIAYELERDTRRARALVDGGRDG